MLGTHIASFIIAPAHNLKSSGNGHRAFRFMNAFLPAFAAGIGARARV